MKEECLICKAPLEYLETDELMECAICYKKENSKTRCCKRDSYLIANSVGLSKHGDYRGAFVVDRYYSHNRSLCFASSS